MLLNYCAACPIQTLDILLVDNSKLISIKHSKISIPLKKANIEKKPTLTKSKHWQKANKWKAKIDKKPTSKKPENRENSCLLWISKLMDQTTEIIACICIIRCNASSFIYLLGGLASIMHANYTASFWWIRFNYELLVSLDDRRRVLRK